MGTVMMMKKIISPRYKKGWELEMKIISTRYHTEKARDQSHCIVFIPD